MPDSTAMLRMLIMLRNASGCITTKTPTITTSAAMIIISGRSVGSSDSPGGPAIAAAAGGGGAAGAGASAFAAGAGALAAAPLPASSTTSTTCPGFTLSPGFTFTSVTLPPMVDGTSRVALSVSSSRTA